MQVSDENASRGHLTGIAYLASKGISLLTTTCTLGDVTHACLSALIYTLSVRILICGYTVEVYVYMCIYV